MFNPQNYKKKYLGFTLIELLVVISIIALLIGILLPALGVARRTARQMTNNTQGRGIHQAMVTFAQSNKEFFPGRESDGDVYAVNVTTNAGSQVGFNSSSENNTNGPSSGNRATQMLNGNYFTGEYLINPSDTVAPVSAGETMQSTTSTANDGGQSYAWLNIASANTQLRAEWKDTLNSQAVILSDRNTGTSTNSTTGVSSVWTTKNDGDWRGMLVWNDGHTTSETTAALEDATKYGSGSLNTTDQLFVDDTSNADSTGNAYMAWDGLTIVTQAD